MKKHYKVTAKLIIIFLIFSLLPVHANELKSRVTLKGIVYEDGLTEVKNKQDLKASLQINEFHVDSGKINFVGVLKYNDNIYDIKSAGNIYASQASYLKDNGITIPFEPSNGFDFLSCSIEKRARNEMLLPANKDIKELSVIKMAIKNSYTNEIIYFEDILPKHIQFDLLYSQQNVIDENISETISLQENWFLPYLQSHEAKSDSEEIGAGVDYVTKNLTDENQLFVSDIERQSSSSVISRNSSFSTLATSPVIGVSADAFITIGKYYYTFSDAYGYYRITNEYPVGTGNRLTQLIKWDTITNAPVPGGANGVSNLSIEVEAEYYYIQSSDTIEIFDNSSHLRIKNPTVQLALLTGNSDIITRVEKNVTCNSSSLSINWKSWMGLVPYGSTFLKFYNLATSVELRQESSTSNVVTFYDRISDSLSAWGKVNKDYKLDIPSDKYLGVEGDKVDLSVGIKKPTDASSYYTYVTGAKQAGYQFDFSIYSTDIWGAYTVNEYTVSKDIYRTYY